MPTPSLRCHLTESISLALKCLSDAYPPSAPLARCYGHFCISGYLNSEKKCHDAESREGSQKLTGIWGLAPGDHRLIQKSHTKKPAKPTEWTIRRPSVGQKNRKRYAAAYSAQSPWGCWIGSKRAPALPAGGCGFESRHVHQLFHFE